MRAGKSMTGGELADRLLSTYHDLLITKGGACGAPPFSLVTKNLKFEVEDVFDDHCFCVE
jgi:hypothetical protein